MEVGLSGTHKEIFTLDNLNKIRHMGMECIFMRMGVGMKEIGSKTSKKVKVKKYGMMDLIILDITRME